MRRNNQRIPIRVQCDSIIQSLKKADFLEAAAGSVRLFCPAFVCPCGSAAQGIFYLPKGVKEYESEIYLPQLWDPFGL